MSEKAKAAAKRLVAMKDHPDFEFYLANGLIGYANNRIKDVIRETWPQVTKPRTTHRISGVLTTGCERGVRARSRCADSYDVLASELII